MSFDWDNIQDFIETLGLTGHGVSITYSPEYENWSVQLRGLHDGCKNFGQCLYSNGKTLEQAILAACYKHYEVLEGFWPDESTTPKSDIS